MWLLFWSIKSFYSLRLATQILWKSLDTGLCSNQGFVKGAEFILDIMTFILHRSTASKMAS